MAGLGFRFCCCTSTSKPEYIFAGTLSIYQLYRSEWLCQVLRNPQHYFPPRWLKAEEIRDVILMVLSDVSNYCLPGAQWTNTKVWHPKLVVLKLDLIDVKVCPGVRAMYQWLWARSDSHISVEFWQRYTYAYVWMFFFTTAEFCWNVSSGHQSICSLSCPSSEGLKMINIC